MTSNGGDVSGTPSVPLWFVDVLGDEGWTVWSVHVSEAKAVRSEARLRSLLGLRYGLVRRRKKVEGEE